MMLVLFLVGVVVGIAVGVAWAVWFTSPIVAAVAADPSRYQHYRGGYHEGHADGAVGIWRGGPLR